MIELRHIHKTYNPGTPAEVRALQDVSLRVEKGSFLVIVGSNGSGKSSLLNIVAGADQADTGSILVDDADVTRVPAWQRATLVGRVFQDPFRGTVPRLTVVENLALASRRGLPRGFGLALTALFREEVATRVSQFGLGLEHKLDQPIGALSGGERQAVTLLMATWRRPELLLLDEHTAALDPKSADMVVRMTQRIITHFGLTVLMVTHSMEMASRVGDRLVMMHRGRVVHRLEGAEKRGARVQGLVRRFEEVRREELLDEGAVDVLRRQYL
jgi:putative tryptophan/tyrosine transport system ATP-binding protein